MKIGRLFLVAIALTVLTACASLKSLPTETLDNSAEAILGSPSVVEPIQLALLPEYTTERVTLVRTWVTSGNSSSPSQDSILGLYFGNGLYLDQNGNLSLVVPALMGIGENFIGKTEFLYHIPTAAASFPGKETIEYTSSQLVMKKEGGILSPSATVERNAKNAKAWGSSIAFLDGRTKIAPDPFIPLISAEYSWEKTNNGWKQTSGMFFSAEYSLLDGKIIDKDKSFIVENTGKYLRFAYTKGDKFAYRIYRSPGKVLVMDENSGGSTMVTVDSSRAVWQERRVAMMGATDDLETYTISVVQ